MGHQVLFAVASPRSVERITSYIRTMLWDSDGLLLIFLSGQGGKKYGKIFL
jgi:hypothetical protein